MVRERKQQYTIQSACLLVVGWCFFVKTAQSMHSMHAESANCTSLYGKQKQYTEIYNNNNKQAFKATHKNTLWSQLLRIVVGSWEHPSVRNNSNGLYFSHTYTPSHGGAHTLALFNASSAFFCNWCWQIKRTTFKWRHTVIIARTTTTITTTHLKRLHTYELWQQTWNNIRAFVSS